MKSVLIVMASLVLFACGGDDSDRSAEKAPANVIDELADTMHSAIDKAEAVEDLLMENKEALDEAIEEATD